MEIARLLSDARHSAGLTQSELAARSGTSQATLCAYETGAKSPTAATLARILSAAGARLTTQKRLRPVLTPTQAELGARGEILGQVIDLAERLPSRTSATLRYPPIPRPRSAR